VDLGEAAAARAIDEMVAAAAAEAEVADSSGWFGREISLGLELIFEPRTNNVIGNRDRLSGPARGWARERISELSSLLLKIALVELKPRSSLYFCGMLSTGRK
jgi:hypothetical protein